MLRFLLVAVVVFAVVMEAVLWRLFLHRIEPILFPHDADTSHLRFFTLTRMRGVALGHTLALVAAVVWASVALW